MALTPTAQKLESLATPAAVVHAYRTLLRHGLEAVSYARPARYTIRDTLRSAFRSASRGDFDPCRIANTVAFLARAAQTTGFEHRIVKNLVLVKRWERKYIKRETKLASVLYSDNPGVARKCAFKHYYATLAMLNESLGTCLK